MLALAMTQTVLGLKPNLMKRAVELIAREDYDALKKIIADNAQNTEALGQIGDGIRKKAPEKLATGSRNALYNLCQVSKGHAVLEQGLMGALYNAIDDINQNRDFERFNDALRLAKWDYPFIAPAIGRKQIIEAANNMFNDGFPVDLLELQRLRTREDQELNGAIDQLLEGVYISGASRIEHPNAPTTAIMIPKDGYRTFPARAQIGKEGG